MNNVHRPLAQEDIYMTKEHQLWCDLRRFGCEYRCTCDDYRPRPAETKHCEESASAPAGPREKALLPSKQSVSISAEGSELMAELFNRMPIEALKNVPEPIATRVGDFMIANGYRIVFDRWYLQEEPRSTDETKPTLTEAARLAEIRAYLDGFERTELPSPREAFQAGWDAAARQPRSAPETTDDGASDAYAELNRLASAFYKRIAFRVPGLLDQIEDVAKPLRITLGMEDPSEKASDCDCAQKASAELLNESNELGY